MQIAVIADVHGNLRALQAVLADIDRRRIHHIVNLGDCLYGPLEPAETATLLRNRDIPTIRGNQDRILMDPTPAVRESPTFRFVDQQLDTATRSWLDGLPNTLQYRDLFLCHGTPHCDETYLLEEVHPHRVLLKSSDAIAPLLQDVEEQVILCGHSHVPHLVQLADGRLVINPGSVGLQAYTDDLPHPHGMESGSPHARYAVLENTDSGWLVEQLSVPYDHSQAATTADSHGRADWARWLQYGRA